jgi:CelD/BcsL family acetyltransferase involved in cellulose biosynthesis
LKLSICRPDELGATEVGLWRGWQRADDRLANPFLCPEFAVAAGRHLAGARVAVMEEEGVPCGFFSYEARRLGVGRALAYDLSDQQAVVCRPGYRWDARVLLKGCGLAVWEFDALASHQVEQLGPREVTLAASPVIDLRQGWDDWLARKKRQSPPIKESLRKRRKLEREVGPLSFTLHSGSHADLRRLMAWKSEQYVRTGRVDRFARPWFRELVADLLDSRTEGFGLELSRLDAGDRCVALQLTLRSEDVLAAWFPAYDTAVARYSPGMACTLAIVEAGTAAGQSYLDLGHGAAEYKELLKDFDVQVAQGWVERPGVASTARRWQQAPRRAGMRVVLGNPRLRVAARHTLNLLGRIRLARRGR